MSRRSVDFPHPLGPTIEINSPAPTSSVTASSARTRTSGLSGAGKLLLTLRTRSEEPSVAMAAAGAVTT